MLRPNNINIKFDCACGYKDSTGVVWVSVSIRVEFVGKLTFGIQRASFTSDFTTGSGDALSANFYKFGWAENHANAPYVMQYNVDNIYGYNDGPGLKTLAFASGSVQTAGIGSLRSDILYGSFRMRATVLSVSAMAIFRWVVC